MKKILYLLIAFTGLTIGPNLILQAQVGGVGVNAGGSPPDVSAGLDVNFTTKGVLMPRMTTAQRDAIATPANGLTIFNTDCNVYNFNAGTPSSPNWVTMNSSNVITASVSIAASPVGAICSGTGVTFTATPGNGLNSPNYQWQLNGVNVGTNSSTYINDSLNNGDVVTCVLSTTQACVTGSPANSNSITMTINPAPSIPGSVTGNTGVCANSTGNIYSISPVSGATSYSWGVPGDASITSGSGNTSITVTFGSQSGNISVAAVNSCGTGPQVNDAITVTAIPSTPGSITGNNSVCPNATAQVYSVSPVSGATGYNWSVPSGATITGSADNNITVTYGSGSPVGNVGVTASNGCGTSGQSTLSISQSGICPPVTFSYTGSVQTFTVPSGVTSVTITTYGAQGHIGSPLPSNPGGTNVGTGGLGGQATGTLTVTPGQNLYVYVGGQSGYNGGGAGGNGGGNWGPGGAGGGASDIRVGGTALSNRVIVAGGGGGGGGEESAGYGGSNGGTGGGTTGGSGYYNASCPGGCFNATGGTQSAGGSGGGDTGCGGNCTAASGSLGQGGQGLNYNSWAGGGGRGGYYGGGGGSSWGGGDGGGGGSGYTGGVTNASMQDGVQSGNGQVVITW